MMMMGLQEGVFRHRPRPIEEIGSRTFPPGPNVYKVTKSA